MGYFPNKFKTAKIILLTKPNKKGINPLDYRPISLLEVPSKIYEKIINKRLRHFIESNNALPNTQHGFRVNRSTETAIAVTQEKIAHALATKQQCYIVQRDVAKAFDKVWHEGLLYKLIKLRLPDILIKIISTFLNNRSGRISINNYIGPIFPIRSGVPQGSAISPTLYSIYTADIPQAAPGSLNIMYADDITQIITHPSKSKNIMARHVSREIQAINEYEKRWKIKTNTTKFKIIPLATIKTVPIVVDGQIIPYTNEGNILGLHFNKHGFTCQAKINKARGKVALYILKRFSYLPTNIKLHLIKAYVIPVLTYPTYPLNSLAKQSILSLQQVQNSALRYAYNERYPYQKNTQELHENAALQPINIIAYKRGVKIKEKLERIIQDRNYIEIIELNMEDEHGWFRKPINVLKRAEPKPIYIKNQRD